MNISVKFFLAAGNKTKQKQKTLILCENKKWEEKNEWEKQIFWMYVIIQGFKLYYRPTVLKQLWEHHKTDSLINIRKLVVHT